MINVNNYYYIPMSVLKSASGISNSKNTKCGI